ncbi:hypothetical protein [Psychrobacter pygoscelis]|uniref:hypothetical protein n=1 Tax=Psychrobacter pygoscelis TaxID=2488563 RepID=UPI00103CEAEC|nr:hypothetical protein [Psychrobacter pygoscelis]
MTDIIEPLFMALLGLCGLSGVLAILLLIYLIFIKDADKRQPLERLLNASLLVCIISFCVGFGICSYILVT